MATIQRTLRSLPRIQARRKNPWGIPGLGLGFSSRTAARETRETVQSGPALPIKLPKTGAFVPPEGKHVNDRDLWRLVEMIERSEGKTLVITGAGVSTESGIPDYRSPEGSYSKGHKPMTHQDFTKREHNRKRYWARSLLGWRYFDSVAPSFPHYSLADLEAKDHIHGIVTQNVDRLHLRAGSRNVVELHGHNDHVQCLSCGHRRPRNEYQLLLEEVNRDWAERNFAPVKEADIRADGDAHLSNEDFHEFSVPSCDACGDGILMPTVVFFGGSIPVEVKDRAMELVQQAKSMLILGSSCQVFSVYRLALAARKADKDFPIALVNIGGTRVDPLATFKLEAQCGRVLRALSRALE